MIHFHVPLVLASQSPRRKHLLSMLGWTFSVCPCEKEEVIPPNVSPAQVVMALATQKALFVAQKQPEALVLAADTVVVLDDVILGKPRDDNHAIEMLNTLSGRSNTVYTGICLANHTSGRIVTQVERSDVFFYPMSEQEIRRYVASGAPLDKAGAYGIQDDWGALFIERIEGDYYNVMGLPLHLLYKTLTQSFADLWQLDA